MLASLVALYRLEIDYWHGKIDGPRRGESFVDIL